MSSEHAHDHGHHIMPVKGYWTVFGILLVLTVLTWAVSAFEMFHGYMSITVAMLIALTKATLVATFFMHLKWDKRFNVLLFVSSVWFAGLFFIFTAIDLGSRTAVDAALNNTMAVELDGNEEQVLIQTHNLPAMAQEGSAGGEKVGSSSASHGGGH